MALDIKAAADASGKVMCWKSHSMGCYLLLNVVDRLRWKGEDMKSLFGAVILDAPDVPTWFFRSMTKVSLFCRLSCPFTCSFVVEHTTNPSIPNASSFDALMSLLDVA